MSGGSWALLVLTLGLAAGDWWAVAGNRRGAEYLLKPATMVALLGLTVSLDGVDGSARTWFAAAVLASLAGDVLLMLPADRFVAGLASFLVAHVAYLGGLLPRVEQVGPVLAGIAVVGVSLAAVGPRIIGAVAGDHRPLLVPVLAYIVVISAMVIAAVGTWQPAAAVGAVLFYASDATIAWSRFVASFAAARVTIMVTYHLGQTALVLSLL